jgi:hypothetical protein
MVKTFGGQRESDGVVVPLIGVQHNAPGGKGPNFDHARSVGKREGMTEVTRSNHPGKPSLAVADEEPLVVSPVKVRELQRALWAAAKQSEGRRFHALYDRFTGVTSCGRRGSESGRTGVRPGWIGSLWLRWRTTAWTACCVSCAAISNRVGIVPRRRGVWRSRNHVVVSGRWGFRRRRHSHRSSGDDLGFVVVTHPFHPLNGQRLEVLFVKRRAGEPVFVCSGGVGGQMTVPWSWTDRGESPRPIRLSIEGLADLWAATRAIQGC